MTMTMTSDKLSDRLKGMLLETTSPATNPHSSSSTRPLIEVVRTASVQVHCNNGNPKNFTPDSKLLIGDEYDEDDEDDSPPPIFFHGTAATAPGHLTSSAGALSGANRNHHSSGSSSSNNDGRPSLAEKMLADANNARKTLQKQEDEKEQRRAKKSKFGLKRGFLNSSHKGKTTRISRTGDISKLESEKKMGNCVVRQEGSNLIHELDGDGNMVPSSSALSTTNSEQQRTKADDPLHLPEVQSAMLSHLQSNFSQWATSNLFESIPKDHPKLARGMNNPRYMRALQDMQMNPKETLKRLKESDPEIVQWLMEFCDVMGEHFCRLGEEQQQKREAATALNDEKVRELGPLEEKALRKHKEMQKSKNKESNPYIQQQGKQETIPGKDDQVSSILASDELRSMLLDTTMQQIMEECTRGSKLHYYMGHEEYGPKLRKLMEAGLIRLA